MSYLFSQAFLNTYLDLKSFFPPHSSLALFLIAFSTFRHATFYLCGLVLLLSQLDSMFPGDIFVHSGIPAPRTVLAYILFSVSVCWMITCIMQNNSRTYSSISHGHFFYSVTIPFSGCLVNGFIFLSRNYPIKEATLSLQHSFRDGMTLSHISPPFPPLHLFPLVLCLPNLDHSSTKEHITEPPIQREKRRKLKD